MCVGSVNGRGGGCISCASAATAAGFAGDLFYFLIGCCGGPAKKVLQYENKHSMTTIKTQKILELSGETGLCVISIKRHTSKYGPPATCTTECGRKFYANTAIIRYIDKQIAEGGAVGQFIVDISEPQEFNSKDGHTINYVYASCTKRSFEDLVGTIKTQ